MISCKSISIYCRCFTKLLDEVVLASFLGKRQ